MYGCVITEPVTEDGHLGVLFLHNEGFSTMCGHGIIGLATALIETRAIRLPEESPVLRIDTPAGRVTARVRLENGGPKEVSFLNVPSFASQLDCNLHIPGIGVIKVDLAFGGAFYVFCRAEDLQVRLIPAEFRRLIDLGRKVKEAAAKALTINHPVEKGLGFLYGTIIVGPPENPAHHSRNVCIFADGEIDRSPTGTGLSARAAIHSARGDLRPGEDFTVESLIGTCFTGRVAEFTSLGSLPAVIPEIRGCAYLIGKHEFWIDPRDPLPEGFLLR